MQLKASHQTDLAFALQDVSLMYADCSFNLVQSNSKDDTFAAVKGKNRFCLGLPGVYNVRPKSCFTFEKEVYEYDTSSDSDLELQATVRVP